MQWEPQNLNALWLDFTMVTLKERTVHSVDDIMREFSKDPEKHQKSGFQYNEMAFIARLYPSKYSKLKSDDFTFNSPTSFPDSIRYLFNISTPFIVIMPETGRIDEKCAHVMISDIIQAAQSSLFFYPIFVNIPLKHFYQYVGICVSSKKVTHFYSKTEYHYSEVGDYQSSLNFFQTKLKNIRSILFSSRRFLEINNNYFGKDAIYTHSSFYSVVNSDPIITIRILFQWNRASPDSTGPILSNASYIKLSVIYQTNSSPQTPLHIFLNKRISLDGKDDFKIWKSERLNSRIYAFMNNIFHNSKSSSSTFSKPINKSSSTHNFFKSAPENSLLERVAVEIAEMKTLANFAMIWSEFLKNIRYCAEQSILIPDIGDSVNYEYCLIYQNLQIINCYIKNGNQKFCMAENIFDQYVELYKKAKKESILKMLIVAFKNQFKNPDFESFQKVLSLSKTGSSNEILIVWEKTSQENFEFDKKEAIEFALDYLEGLKPSEVHLQIILVLFDIAFRDLSKRAPIEVPFASTPYDSLVKLLKEKKDASTLPDFKLICAAIEDTTLKCEIVNSALSKIPSAKFVNQLFEKGYSSMDNQEEIQAVTSLIEVMNLDNLLMHTAANEFIFTGKTQIDDNEIEQYLFVSKQRQEGNDKYIVALAYQDLL